MGDVGVVLDPAAPAIVDPTSPPISQSINVLVTGFGPFRSFDINASSLIAQSLPSSITLPPNEPLSVGGTGIPAPRVIQIHVHPEPIKVSYATIRAELPVILDNYARAHNGSRPDLIMHIGIASTRKYYSVELQAHRDNYRIPDVDGNPGYNDGERIWREQGLPPVLFPGPAETPEETLSLPLRINQPLSNVKVSPYPANNHFLQTWKSYSRKDTDIRISADAGRYACEFIFYSSLARAYQEGRDRSVAFFHVPIETDDASIELGNKVAVALIKSMVKCWVDGE